MASCRSLGIGELRPGAPVELAAGGFLADTECQAAVADAAELDATLRKGVLRFKLGRAAIMQLHSARLDSRCAMDRSVAGKALADRQIFAPLFEEQRHA